MKESATVAQCWRAPMLLVGMLEEVFLNSHPAQLQSPPDAGARERWRTRYMAALGADAAGRRSKRSPTRLPGSRHYVSLRKRWDGNIARLRASMLYEAYEIDAPTLVRRPLALDRRSSVASAMSDIVPGRVCEREET